MAKAGICHTTKAAGISGSVQAAIPYQGTPFLKCLWPNLFASGVVYVLEFKE